MRTKDRNKKIKTYSLKKSKYLIKILQCFHHAALQPQWSNIDCKIRKQGLSSFKSKSLATRPLHNTVVSKLTKNTQIKKVLTTTIKKKPLI